ncbi:MAG TPA: type I methionyl aminopeptidase [Gemmatimonadaceae bacterium]|nr:MAG: type I methionyl aminopeptidase [Gemmatimonadetes bacterium SCN 70-22]HMN09168.1 type I methionyl aminopeptidase [Gemmatimonadaceae bacterium]
MIHLKSTREIEIMARGGQLLAQTLELLRSEVRPGITTKALDAIAEEFIRSHAGATAAFKGLYGFPGSVCISVNEEIVHGIPSAKRVLKDGDIVSLDFGVKLDGFYTDSAITVPVGEISAEDQRLLRVTKEALDAGVAAARLGNHIGDIGSAISSVVKAAGFTTADDLVGHYVGTKPHGDPQVPNFGKPKRGPKLLAGLTIAIEPMVNIGGGAIRTLSDRWTVVTADGSRSAHFEHTVAVLPEGPRVLTALA